ncbi:MAG: MucR family transcriptional regulator [Pseudomonadota bacterium]
MMKVESRNSNSLPEIELIQLTAHIVSAYVGQNSIDSSELPSLIKKVHESLGELGNVSDKSAALKPAVPIKKSVTDDYLVCLEDGEKFRSLRRHLRSKYDMSPEEYRDKWGLPHDYPMVAPSYAKQRSDLAKKMGLGQSKKS